MEKVYCHVLISPFVVLITLLIWRRFYPTHFSGEAGRIEQFFHKIKIQPERKVLVLSLSHPNPTRSIFFYPWLLCMDGTVRVLFFFIHGFCVWMGQFASQLTHFRKSYNIIAFDLLGRGKSDKPCQPMAYHPDVQVADSVEVFNHYKYQDSTKELYCCLS